MTKARPSTRAGGAPGVKQLITAASLAGTLAGWALLTPRPAPEQAMVAAEATAAGQPAAPVAIEPLIMPTLVPVATAAAAAPLVQGQAEPAAQAPVVEAPVVEAPAPLREVSAPAPPAVPPPVTSTRSSR